MVMLALGLSSCLVTASPDFSPPKCTRPQILDHTAIPNPAKLVQFLPAVGGGYSRTYFSADVVSEDTSCEDPSRKDDVLVALLIDLGQPNPGGKPYLHGFEGTPLPGASLADGPRRASVGWTPELSTTALGCHTATLVATHELTKVEEYFYCPKDPNDMSMLTWFVTLCSQTSEPGAPTQWECEYDNCPTAGEQVAGGDAGTVSCLSPSKP
ncbi:MAG: hypothetical protein HY744_10000 [Deltaproteobacteria bacterium]|nr:hypothetical protein [Deltaproteobacteria bacterium]